MAGFTAASRSLSSALQIAPPPVFAHLHDGPGGTRSSRSSRRRLTTDRSCAHSYPSCTSWCALRSRSSPFAWLNCSEMSWPNGTTRGRVETAEPHRSSGSDHSKSHMGPSCGTSRARCSSRTWSSVSRLGLRPPCTAEALSFSTVAARRGGRTRPPCSARRRRRRICGGTRRSVRLRDLPRLVVAAAERRRRATAPSSPTPCTCLHGVVPAANVVAEEQVVRLGALRRPCAGAPRKRAPTWRWRAAPEEEDGKVQNGQLAPRARGRSGGVRRRGGVSSACAAFSSADQAGAAGRARRAAGLTHAPLDGATGSGSTGQGRGGVKPPRAAREGATGGGGRVAPRRRRLARARVGSGARIERREPRARCGAGQRVALPGDCAPFCFVQAACARPPPATGTTRRAPDLPTMPSAHPHLLVPRGPHARAGAPPAETKSGRGGKPRASGRISSEERASRVGWVGGGAGPRGGPSSPTGGGSRARARQARVGTSATDRRLGVRVIDPSVRHRDGRRSLGDAQRCPRGGPTPQSERAGEEIATASFAERKPRVPRRRVGARRRRPRGAERDGAEEGARGGSSSGRSGSTSPRVKTTARRTGQTVCDRSRLVPPPRRETHRARAGRSRSETDRPAARAPFHARAEKDPPRKGRGLAGDHADSPHHHAGEI